MWCLVKLPVSMELSLQSLSLGSHFHWFIHWPLVLSSRSSHSLRTKCPRCQTWTYKSFLHLVQSCLPLRVQACNLPGYCVKASKKKKLHKLSVVTLFTSAAWACGSAPSSWNFFLPQNESIMLAVCHTIRSLGWPKNQTGPLFTFTH